LLQKQTVQDFLKTQVSEWCNRLWCFPFTEVWRHD